MNHMTMKELRKEFKFEETPDGLVITKWKGKDSKCVIPEGCDQHRQTRI